MPAAAIAIALSRSFRAPAVLCLVIALACGASAQSGRKPPKRDPDPPAQPPASAPIEHPDEHRSKPKIAISAAKYMASMNVPSSIGSFLLAECARRLEQSGVCKVSTGKDLSRKEAIDIAKGSTDTLVLWIQLGVDAADDDIAAAGPANLRNLVETYVLFESGTGKIRTQGRLYVSADQTSTSRGGILVPYSGANRGTRGLTPEEAAEETAHYVLDSLAGRTASGSPSIHP